MVRLEGRRTSQGLADHRLASSFFAGMIESARSSAFLLASPLCSHLVWLLMLTHKEQK
jgi:hypothetical protein